MLTVTEKIESIPVDEYTSPNPSTVNRKASYNYVVETMKSNGFRHIPVMEGDTVVGIISERDLKIPRETAQFIDLKAEEIMTKDPYRVDSNTPLGQVVFTMSRDKIGSAIVEDSEGNVTGIFTVTDALNALVEVLRGQGEGAW